MCWLASLSLCNDLLRHFIHYLIQIVSWLVSMCHSTLIFRFIYSWENSRRYWKIPSSKSLKKLKRIPCTVLLERSRRILNSFQWSRKSITSQGIQKVFRIIIRNIEDLNKRMESQKSQKFKHPLPSKLILLWSEEKKVLFLLFYFFLLIKDANRIWISFHKTKNNITRWKICQVYIKYHWLNSMNWSHIITLHVCNRWWT